MEGREKFQLDKYKGIINDWNYDGRPTKFGTLLYSVHIHTLLICVVCTLYGSYVEKITFVVKLAGNKETVLISILYYLTCVMCFECNVAMLTYFITYLLHGAESFLRSYPVFN